MGWGWWCGARAEGRSCQPARGRRERGAVAVMAIFLITFVIGAFMALSLNLGLMMETRTELQRASDSAALAAAGSLNGLPSGLTVARSMAVAYSLGHTVTREPVTIDEGADVELGRWHRVAGSCAFSPGQCGPGFEPAVNPVADAFSITAVRVSNGRDSEGTHNSSLPTLFGGAFLTDRQNQVRSRAVAVGPGAAAFCPLPFLLSQCAMPTEGSGNSCEERRVFHLGSDTVDGVGLINLLPGAENAPSPSDVPDMIHADCSKLRWSDADNGDYKFSNGNDMNEKIIAALLGTDGLGQCVLGQRRAFPVANLGCSNPKFSGTGQVTFQEATIVSVSDNQGNVYDRCPDTSGSIGGIAATGQGAMPSGGGPKRSLTILVHCASGGALRDVTTERVLRLVQ